MSLSREEIKAKIFEIIAEQLSIAKEKIKEEDTFESLGADSLDRVEFVMKLEEQFDIEIDDAQAEKLKNVSQTIDYIFSKINSSEKK